MTPNRAVNSLKRFVLILALLVTVAIAIILLFDMFIVEPINLPTFIRETIRVTLIIGLWSIVLIFVFSSKPVMVSHVGPQATMIIQFFIGLIAVLIMVFSVLQSLGVSPASLLTGAGIATITIGLIVSTFVGNFLSGGLVFLTHRLKIGDRVLVGNIPGKVLEMTMFSTKIRNDIGQVSIPNSAIASGAVIVTKIDKDELNPKIGLPYELGDRVTTTYIAGEGIVKKITSLHTIILMDTGKELKFLNSSVLTGTVAVARISQQKAKQDNGKV